MIMIFESEFLRVGNYLVMVVIWVISSYVLYLMFCTMPTITSSLYSVISDFYLDKIIWLVVYLPLWKFKVSWDDDIPNIHVYIYAYIYIHMKNMEVSWDDDIPDIYIYICVYVYMESHKINVPNHQSVSVRMLTPKIWTKQPWPVSKRPMARSPAKGFFPSPCSRFPVWAVAVGGCISHHARLMVVNGG